MQSPLKEKLLYSALVQILKPREGTRAFVDFQYEEVTIDNIKEACQQHFNETLQCDVLASHQGPSCTRIDQLTNTKLFYVRFVALQNKLQNITSKEYSNIMDHHVFTVPPNIVRHEKSVPWSTNLNTASTSKRKNQSVIPKSLSVLDMMKLGKLIKKKPS